MKILFLDYKDDYQQALFDFLRDKNNDVVVGQSYGEVLELFKNEKPDFLIVNWDHPEINNTQFYDNIKSFLKKDYNPLIILANEDDVAKWSKDIKFEQVYWFSKKTSLLELNDWFGEQVKLKSKYTKVVNKTCIQEACHITTAILNAVPSALVVIDELMGVKNYNHGFSKLFKLKPTSITDKHICELIHNGEKYSSLEDHIATCPFVNALEKTSSADKRVIGEELALIGENGEERFFMIMTSRLPSVNYRLLIDIRNVTERKKQEADMALRDRLASLGGLSIGVAHEINNPNGAIRIGIKNISTILEMINPLIDDVKTRYSDMRFGSMSIDKTMEKLPQLCSGSLNATDRVAAVVNNLKKFGRKDLGSGEIQFDVNKTVKNAVQLTNHILNESGVLELQLTEDIPTIKGHETEIEQVLINLISNACDSIKEKKAQTGDNFTGMIKIRSFVNENVFVEVTDNGGGIKEDVKDKIFDPYYTSKPYGIGTGIGLSISLNIIKKNNGNITCRSIDGEGTTFCLELIHKL